MWEVKPFKELSLEELYEIYRVRSDVFVEEQKITESDPDENDKIALHVFETDGNRITAYARIFSEQQYVTFGRVLTTGQVRGTGKGRGLLQEIMRQIKLHFPGLPIEIEAQFYAVGYYKKSGFKTFGNPFIEAGVKHIKMIHDSMQKD
ncbi:GNAT family N-acetyltransferase [Fructilactobacillus sanfranciscensis]|uniref:GNAT family N-acetyltransferase n=1 Tax=Fructilactobacillus sanfranciscensis TaxID=1625 RepID=UPI0006EF0D6F|nr:GNAT family N-acetyltransferase [Fructilactobacillus sanfranciscensis]KRM80186.1 hypothetical protein FD36_GL000593 [Fructilactobacillus sanfranciscensis DSM 20451]POH23694.1 hypothetical protein BHU32_05995 [Fructilactobacillus sanfranciscensis DSM 20451]